MSTNTIAGFRLSQQQERIWAQSQANPAARFGARVMVLLEGRLEPRTLQACADKVVARHEILRTVFQRQAGFKIPFQVIRDQGSVEWELIDVTASAGSSQQEKLQDAFRDISDRAVDTGRNAVLRGAIATLAPDKHALMLSLPALCGDARTLDNIVRELCDLYNGQEPSPDVMQYADYVEWQHELLNGEDAKAGQHFWREYCRKANIGSAALLPLERNRTGDEGFHSLTFAIRNVESVDAVAGRTSTDLANVLLTCWNVLLCRLTGQSEITIGCEFNGRKFEELESAVGPFSRYLPLHHTLESAESFLVVLAKLTNAAGEVQNWQDSFSWSQIQAEHDGIIPVGFDYNELPGKQAGGGIRWQVVRQQVVNDGFKLRLSALRSEDGLMLEFHYDASRLTRSAVERIAGYFQTLLAAAMTAPETPVSRLPLLDEGQRKQILFDWNQTAADYPRSCFHELFQAQAARTPERPALRFNEGVLSYSQLNEKSNQLAHYLRRQGVGPDQVVGLCLERSTEMMIAVLAILKAGGAYVPLNPDNPKPRLAQQLAAAVALITEQKLAAQMPDFAGVTLCLDRDQKLWANEPVSNPPLTTTPDNLVYVIYTSGSTGVPKGVAVRHRNLVNYTQFIVQRLELENYPGGLNFATVSTMGADLGNTCIYPALASGGCLHVISYEVSTDAQRFADYCSKYPIDVLKIVPSHLAALLHSAEAKSLLPRSFLITGGESLTAKLLERVEELGAGCEVLNHYGPTETTVGSLTLRVNQYDWKNSPSIPIGRPIANTQIYILDTAQQPVPVGVVGELYIAGAGVTAGYLNQPERTAERFLANPFVSDAAAKMYRTGDLARYDEQGRVEFLGRGDDQVKIRGFRIELGEIEAVLAKHPGVKQAVVLAKEDERGDKRLVGYVVAHREHTISSDELKTYLQQHLPDYMVPGAMVALPKIPLTPNGKIDRQALPAPEQVQAKTYVAPRNPTEETVARIWAEVLRRDRISVDDNFFDLGGHSLMATQVVSRVREQLRVELGIRALFEKPTIAGLADVIDSPADDSAASDSPIIPVARDAYRANNS